MDVKLRNTLAEALDRDIRDARPISGGDIGESFCVSLDDGTRVFAKRYGEGPSEMPEAEARGLRWLAEAETIRIPAVLATRTASPALIVLEWIDIGTPAQDFDEELGRALARLHATGADKFGFERDNFIGRLPQSNRAHESWVAFYAEERIANQLRRAAESGRVSSKFEQRTHALLERLPELAGPAECPARLHGDLWSGNLIVAADGSPCLIDPAVHGGHREMDLAMMKLFGGFSERVFDAYHEYQPLAPGFEERIPLWQLYPLLVHVNLFGGSYVDSAERVLRRYS